MTEVSEQETGLIPEWSDFTVGADQSGGNLCKTGVSYRHSGFARKSH